MKICPTCGQPIAPEIKITGKRRQQVFDYVARHPGCSREDIVRAVYADDPNGGPESFTVISTMVWFINRQLEPHNLRIMGTGGPGSTYALKPFRISGRAQGGRPYVRLTPRIVKEIRASGQSTRAIAVNYGISKDTAWRIKRGEHALCQEKGGAQ